jgi:hypothetical protein
VRVGELKAELEVFRTRLTEHFTLWCDSLSQPIPDFPVRNIQALAEQSSWLARTLGKLRPFIDRFASATNLVLPATGAQWDIFDSAVGNDVCQRKGPSLERSIQQLDQILGRLDAMNAHENIHDDKELSAIGRKAITLFKEQLERLASLRSGDADNPEFVSWRDTTKTLFRKFLPDSTHLERYAKITFRRLPSRRSFSSRYNQPPGYDKSLFQRGCTLAEHCMLGAIEEIERFDIEVPIQDGEKTANSGGGVQQIFRGPVTIHNQAIATDKAIQNIGQIGNTGADLKEIAVLLDQSLDLTGRQKLHGLKALEMIASETRQPEPSRNWKSIVDWGGQLMETVNKATDMATKLAPHLPIVTALIQAGLKRI